MVENKLLTELAEKLYKNLPNSNNLSLFKEDITSTFKLVLEQSFSELDLVTRQQFDIQSKVLAKTREQLEKLSTKVQELESTSKV